MSDTSISSSSQREQLLQWVARISNGDSEAEYEFVVHFYPRVKRQVLSKLGSQCKDGEQVALDALVAALVNLRNGQYSPEQGELPSYIFIITRNLIYKHLAKNGRRDGRQRTVDPRSLEGVESVSTELELEVREKETALLAALDALAPKYRNPIRLKYFEGKCHAKIKRELGLRSEQQVSNRISYGLALLRKSLDKDIFY